MAAERSEAITEAGFLPFEAATEAWALISRRRWVKSWVGRVVKGSSVEWEAFAGKESEEETEKREELSESESESESSLS